MRRTTVQQLVLVNWKGMFYERFLLDAGVTALEGDNGAGKTTVMIAAYVVLLPDKTYLRFDPLTETGARAKDRGLWGRLGEAGDAYAALDFQLASGDRLVAGVRLERTSKTGGELHPFLIRDLPDDASLQGVLLDRVGDEEEVPSRDRLRSLAAVAGGRLTWCGSVADYLRELFDSGVTPMPMVAGDERAKLNQLLKTSMTGGISRQLGEGLRHFLLRPDEGLGTTLKRIRANLDDCRRTRLLVADAQRSEREVQSVLEAGLHMFAAAVEGARRQASERERNAEEAREAEAKARVKLTRLAAEAEDAAAERDRSELAEQAAEAAEEKAQAHQRTVEKAHGVWVDLLVDRERRTALQARHVEAGKAHDAKVGELEEAEERVRSHELDHQQAADGMADIQAGLERLHGKASRYRTVVAALARARALLPDFPFADEEVAEALRHCEGEATAATRVLTSAQARLDTAAETERAFRSVYAPLCELNGGPVDDSEAHALALRLLADLHKTEQLAGQLAVRRHRVAETKSRLAKQREARAEADKLSTEAEALSSSEDVRQARERSVTALSEAQDRALAARELTRRLRQEHDDQRAQIADLERKAEEHDRVRSRASRLGQSWGRSVTDSASGASLLAWLQGEETACGSREERTSEDLTRTYDELTRLRDAGGRFPDALMEAVEHVDGRLLVERFEDVALDMAAETEATLGPLAHAVLVSDVDASTRSLVEVEGRPDTIWLLDGAAESHVLGGDQTPARMGDAVAVPVSGGVRLTRLPTEPVVGRQARQRRIEELEARRAQLEEQLAEIRTLGRRLSDGVSQATALLPFLGVLDSDPPGPLLEEARAAFAAREQALAKAAAAEAMTEGEVSKHAGRKSALESLWPDSGFLDPPDYAQLLAAHESELQLALEADLEVTATARPRKKVQEGLDLLRTPPPTAVELDELTATVATATLSRERWLEPQPDLSTVASDLEALGFEDAERKIREDESMLASLKQEVDEAANRLERARSERDGARELERATEEKLRGAASALQVCTDKIGSLEAQFEEIGVLDASAEALAQSRSDAQTSRAKLRETRDARRAAGEAVARLDPQVKGAEEAVTSCERHRIEREAQARPAALRWEALRGRCVELRLLDAAQRDPELEGVEGKASVDVFQLRDQWWKLLLDRLVHTEDGPELAVELQAVIESAAESGGERYLQAWLATRIWLARRVPKHVSEVDDPVQALRSLQLYLGRLGDRLERDEHRLRGDSRDVARAIEGRLRKVSNLLNRLNRDLRGVGFGSIAEIRVQSERDQRMKDVLDALSSPDDQQLLFRPDVPIEEALDELFQRHGGRREGGRRLLDYREYIRLRVEVRRRGGEAWERAQGNEMSTGESIGVGAAIMMVVLTAWEREANLLRARRDTGTLRLLFLDEATRLDQVNLATLFDLCGSLDLQLLIAAPEVATVAGNTTYVLERKRDTDGSWVVRVSGRRAIRAAQ